MKTKPVTHLYVPGESDHATLKPRVLCATCGLPKTNQRHQLRPQDATITAYERRKTGDR